MPQVASNALLCECLSNICSTSAGEAPDFTGFTLRLKFLARPVVKRRQRFWTHNGLQKGMIQDLDADIEPDALEINNQVQTNNQDPGVI